MEKHVAINILEDIEQLLNVENAKQRALKTIEIYIKGLEISTNTTIIKLINKQKEVLQKYGENDKKTLKLNKKIDKEIKKILKK